MKKLLYLLIVALMAALAVSCKKGNESNAGFKDNDLIGYWACTKSVSINNGDTGINPPYSLVILPNHEISIYDNKGLAFDGTWALNGDKLDLTGDGKVQDITLKKLDGKHLSWIQEINDGEIYRYQEDYSNVSTILPGTWKSTSGIGSHTITISQSGTSVWVKEGTTDEERINWTLVVDGNTSRIVIKFQGDNVDFIDNYTINSVADNKLIMTNVSNGEVQFDRQKP